MSGRAISVIGAREHNLKNINLKIPRNKFVVFTGVSGSGKSSLVFDTIYAEGQRRYVESLSTYARQFLDQLQKPDVESIDGLSAAIAIEQRTVSKSPRSTVGTVTEIYDYLRVLYARLGRAFCPNCGNPITTQTVDQMMDQILKIPSGQKISVLAPIVRERKGEYQKELHDLRQQGFVKVKIDGEIFDLSESIYLDKNKKHTVEVYVDRIIIKSTIEPRLRESIELALSLTDQVVKIEREGQPELMMSAKFSCSTCGVNFPEIEPRLFSFNSVIGACSKCRGLGLKDLYEDVSLFLDEHSEKANETITEDHPDFLFHDLPCPACHGQRLKKEALYIKISDHSVFDIGELSLDNALSFFNSLVLSEREKKIGEKILKEICDRLGFLTRVGVHYLTLNRRTATLSGGEAQRIRLAAQIGSSLTGVLYVLDEPSIGLHPKDNQKLIHSLKNLRDLGNTILVVEHDEEMMLNADYLFDMGPGAGIHGGSIVSHGPLSQVSQDPKSLTGAYLRKEKEIPLPKQRRAPSSKILTIEGAYENNLKNLTVQIPLGLFVAVTGVSGSGKSSLIIDILYRSLSHSLHNSKLKIGDHQRILGTEHIESIIDIDQSPIGRTPRSNPATYTGVFSIIRKFFAELPDSKVRGYKPGRYSFNVSGGRCETCGGAGLIKIEMHFLPDMYVQCDICHGERYNRETLEIRYKGKNISEILEMTIEEALDFFDKIPSIKEKLKTLNEVGMGYVHLGQQATTLSGGEAQRIKLSRELSKKTSGKSLFILDEPTTGLHFDDIQKLVLVLQRLVDIGNTVIVIEHNLDVIKGADHIIDLGPQGGEEGGYLLAQGTPEKICANLASATGQYLKKYLNLSD